MDTGKRGDVVSVSKTTSGVVLIAGMVFTIISGRVAAWAGNVVGSPSDDLFYDLIGWAGIGGAFTGLAAFFWGCMTFARK